MVTKSRSANSGKELRGSKSAQKPAANQPKVAAEKVSAKIAQSKKSRAKSAVEKLVGTANATKTQPGSFKEEPWYGIAWRRFSVSHNRSFDKDAISARLLNGIAPSKDN